jgi:16S rRNA (cytosine967-C5)-methyltransferase
VRKAGPRAAALAALGEWRAGRKFADAILGEILAAAELSPPDRAFATELFYGVLRNLTLLDFWIGQLRSAHLDHASRDLVRLGLYQLFLLQTPEHAAIYETVELAGRRNRSLINGVLRNAVRSKAKLAENAARETLAVRRSHPPCLIDRWMKNFGAEETEQLCEWNNLPAPVYARLNRLETFDEEFPTVSAPSTDRAPRQNVPPNFVQLTSVPHEALAAGQCYIQDPSTAAACVLLDPQPGERVLDACAAPGGKTGYLAELMKNEGAIVACDRDERRVEILRDNLERLGVNIARCVHHDWTGDTPFHDEPGFDRILIDAPCTNTGVMRRRVDVRWRLKSEDFLRMPKLQARIVRAVAPLLKPGGALVYSTCSLEREENEQLVTRIVEQSPSLKRSDEVSVLPFRDGFDGAYAAKLVREV